MDGVGQMADLFDKVTGATGLPNDLITSELEKLVEAAGADRSSLTLEDLRAILADYVQEVLLAAKEEHTDKANPVSDQSPR